MKTTKSKDRHAFDFVPEVQRRFMFDEKYTTTTSARKEEDRRASTANVFTREKARADDFRNVVEQSDDALETSAVRDYVSTIISSAPFRIFFFVVLIINTIAIGLQTDATLAREYANAFSILDQAVLAVFLMEIAFKWYSGFWVFWRSGWNIMDFVIVVMLLLAPVFQVFENGSIIKLLRVLRAARSLRSITGLQGLSLVVQTVIQSLPDMLNIFLVLFIILTVFAVAGVTLFGKETPDTFGDLWQALWSLFICVTQDGWMNIGEKFQSSSGSWTYTAGLIYLVVVITVGSFVFTNLAVAAVSSNLELAMNEIKAENKKNATLGETNAESLTHVPIIPFEEATKGFDFTSQTPIISPDLRGLNTEKFENYCMTLIALEENLAEYKAIREDLNKIFEVVCELNVQEDAGRDQEDHTPKTSAAATADLKKMKGDIMSNLIALTEQVKEEADEYPHNLEEVLKNTARRIATRESSMAGSVPPKSL